MNVQETIAIIEALKSVGASHFKSQDFEITMIPSDSQPSRIMPSPIEPSKEQVKEASAKIADLINTIKMTPEQLADQIFPAGAGG